MSAPYMTTRDSDEAFQKCAYGDVIRFVTKAEATFRFGFYGDAKDIPKRIKQGRSLPKNFAPAVRSDEGTIHPAKYGERYHADIIRRVDLDAEEGYIYTP